MTLEEELKQKSFKDDFQKGLLNIHFTSGWLYSKSKLFFDRYGISQPQYNILRIIRGQSPNPVNLNDISSRVIDKSSDISRLVDRLIKKKIVEKCPSDTDKRRIKITLTEEGVILLKEIDLSIDRLTAPLSKLSVEEVKTLNDLLDKIRS